MAVTKTDGLFTDVGESNVDLTGKEFYLCKRVAGKKVDLAGAGESVAGVITQGRIAGKHTSFDTLGNPILKALAGGTIAEGAEVQAGAGGLVVSGSTNPIGYARNAAVQGEMVEIATDAST